MNRTIEYERKCMLSQIEYEMLCRMFSEPVYVQDNYYYDTEDFAYNKRGVACIICLSGKRCIATIKVDSASELLCSYEIFTPAKDECDSVLFEGMGVHLQGVLRTERMVVPLADGGRIVLDKNSYLGVVDYEIEITYPFGRITYFDDLCDSSIKRILKDLYLRLPCTRSKAERFFVQKSQCI